MALDIKVIKKKDYVYVVELKGSLDTDTHHLLKEELKEVLDTNIKALVMDMAALEYISSIGISVVLEAKKALKKKNATFAMINLQPQIEKVFDAMKILPIVSIFHDMEEADKYIDQIIKDEVAKNSK